MKIGFDSIEHELLKHLIYSNTRDVNKLWNIVLSKDNKLDKIRKISSEERMENIDLFKFHSLIADDEDFDTSIRISFDNVFPCIRDGYSIYVSIEVITKASNDKYYLNDDIPYSKSSILANLLYKIFDEFKIEGIGTLKFNQEGNCGNIRKEYYSSSPSNCYKYIGASIKLGILLPGTKTIKDEYTYR